MGATRSKVSVCRELRAEATPAEKFLWQLLRRQALGVKFRRQHPVAGWILDFYSPAMCLGIEVDGPLHDFQADEDIERQKCLEGLGIRIVRVRNHDVFDDPEGTLQRIEAALRS